MVNDVVMRFGKELLIKDVLVGKNLNVWVIRGYATLDQLAYISVPDVYNQLTNPFGTQRNPDRSHAKQVLEYALSALDEEPESSPRAFPEIILNARDVNVISIFRGASDEEVEFSSNSSSDDSTFHGHLKIRTDNLNQSGDRTPQISRVDGNHRLLMVKDWAESEPDEEFPVVPFALFIGLTSDQERALFRDINGEQKSMDTAHLDTIQLKLKPSDQLLGTESGAALWIADNLAGTGQPFENLVFYGGDKKGFKDMGQQVPPIKINALKSAVLTTLRDSKQMALDAEDTSIDEMSKSKMKLNLLSRYWNAVKKAFPDAWQDKKSYILLQAIGLNAFSRLGAVVIDELMEKQTPEPSEFDLILKHVASKVDLHRDNWLGMAGLAGAKQVFNELYKAKNSDYNMTVLMEKLLDKEVSPLDNGQNAP